MNEIETLSDKLAPIRKMIQTCIQCGTCTGSCPNEFAMDFTPRQLWRLLLMDETEEIFHSRTFVLCSACYCCTLRCPRGLPLTEAMGELKQIAAKENFAHYNPSVRFYKSFMESIRRHGRVRETEFMTLYFASMKSPFLPLRFAPLGLRLMSKGKVHLQIPSQNDPKSLDALFRKAEETEKAGIRK